VKNVLPATVNRFVIAAFNENGRGGSSEPAHFVTSLPERRQVANRTIIYGVGSFVEDIRDTPCTGPLVTLSDASQTLRLDGNTIDAWSAHHSPRLFDVRAELLRSDPLDGCAPLKRPLRANGRIVVSKRGGCPFVVKLKHAQDAGAIGLIIVDDGRCDGAFDESCSRGSRKDNQDGFASHDDRRRWFAHPIPVIMVRRSSKLF